MSRPFKRRAECQARLPDMGNTECAPGGTKQKVHFLSRCDGNRHNIGGLASLSSIQISQILRLESANTFECLNAAARLPSAMGVVGSFCRCARRQVPSCNLRRQVPSRQVLEVPESAELQSPPGSPRRTSKRAARFMDITPTLSHQSPSTRQQSHELLALLADDSCPHCFAPSVKRSRRIHL